MAQDLNDLADKLHRCAGEDLTASDEASKKKLLSSAYAIVNALESPAERLARLFYSTPGTISAIKVLIDLDIFKTLADSKEPRTAQDLAKGCNADAALLARLLKHLAAEGFVRETGADTYTASGLTSLVASRGGTGLVKDTFMYGGVTNDGPQFFKESHYENPTNAKKSIWMHSRKTDQHFFEWVMSSEERVRAFHDHMSLKTLGPKWFHNRAVIDSVFEKQLSKDEVLLVDIGGNNGADLIDFAKAFPDMPGRLVLQDLPAVIDGADAAPLKEHHIEPMKHDMFTPQPIKGASAYYLKMVLHDWPDTECVKALTQLKPALVKGQSVILLNEIVIPEVNAHWFETSVDLLMMTVHSAQERREKDWRRLVESVGGLRVKKIWNVEGALEKVIVIEAE